MKVILLHGFGETSDVWKSLIPLLPAEHEYIALDYSVISFCQTIEEYADWVHSEVLERKIKDFVLIGHSMGGYISLAYAKSYAGFLLGLGLFHSSAMADTDTKKKTRDKTVEFIDKNGTEVFIEDFLPKMYHHAFLKQNAEFIRQNLEDNKQIPSKALQTATIAMRDREDTRDILKNFEKPSLMIIGKADKFISFEDALPQISLCQKPYILILDHIAHAGMHEAPQACANVIAEFLQACETS